MTEPNAQSSKQGNDRTTRSDPRVAHEGGGNCCVAGGAGRLTEAGGPPTHEAGEPGQHPKRIDGSENPDSGDAALENHESGVWNKEREAEEEAGTAPGDRDDKV